MPDYCLPPAAPAVTADAHYDQLFTRSGPGWTGADGGVSTLLPDGRDAWIFDDTWLGTTTGTPPNRTRDLATTPLADGTWWWPNDPVVEGNLLQVPVYQMTAGGSDPFPLASTGVQGIATFTLPALNLVSVTTVMTDPTLPIYGQSILQTPDYDYVYAGDTEGGLSSNSKVARVPRGELASAGAWIWSTGTGWSSDPHDAQDIAAGNPEAVVQRATDPRCSPSRTSATR